MRQGLPKEYYVRLRGARRRTVLCLSLLAVLSGVVTWGSFVGVVPLSLTAVVSAVLLLFLLVILSDLTSLGVGDRCRARIIPYFPREVPDPDTSQSGTEIATNWELLNTIALQRGLTPLSSFGLGGNVPEEYSAWHDAGQGATSVAGLLHNLDRITTGITGNNQLRAELVLLKQKLDGARKLGVPFCLHLRTEDIIGPQDFARRDGTYS